MMSLTFASRFRVLPNGLVTLYHKKVGVLSSVQPEDDAAFQWMTFTGSLNETPSGIEKNAESFALHRSWIDGQRQFAVNERDIFESAWWRRRPQIWTWTVNDWLKAELRNRFGERPPSEEPPVYVHVARTSEHSRPAIPEDLTLRNYQIDAVNEWIDAGCHGIFAMATGTGKTETALAAATRLAEIAVENSTPLLVLVIAPLTDLVNQWAARARRFGFTPLTWHGGTSAAERAVVADVLRRASRGRKSRTCGMVITTADSLVGPFLPHYNPSTATFFWSAMKCTLSGLNGGLTPCPQPRWRRLAYRQHRNAISTMRVPTHYWATLALLSLA